MMELVEFIFGYVNKAIQNIPASIAQDVYALSVYMKSNDLGNVSLEFNINTKSYVQSVMQGTTETQRKWGGKPRDIDEAKWNFAFWSRDPFLVCLQPMHSEDWQLWEKLLINRGIKYSEDDNFDIDRYETAVKALLAEVAIAVVQKINCARIVENLFGRSLPILIHELEYYEEIARYNELANLSNLSLIAEFTDWIRG